VFAPVLPVVAPKISDAWRTDPAFQQTPIDKRRHLLAVISPQQLSQPQQSLYRAASDTLRQ